MMFPLRSALIMVVMLTAGNAWAVIPPPRSPYTAPQDVPAEIRGLRYIAGLRSVDDNKYTNDYRPIVWAELSKKDFALRRQRIDQTTLNEKARKLEQIDLVRIPYKKITEVWYGEDALRKLAVSNLPTVPHIIWDFTTSSYQPLEVFLNQRHRSPIVVLYKDGRKKSGSIIMLASHEKGAAIYTLLIREIAKH